MADTPSSSASRWGRGSGASSTPAGARIGYDAWLHTQTWVDRVAAAIGARDGVLVAVTVNPVDAVWADRPLPGDAAMRVQDDAQAGRTAADKRAVVADWLTEQGCDAVVVSALDSVAWAFNVRGGDVQHTPVAQSYAILAADGTAELFVAPNKITAAVAQHLGNAVTLHHYASFGEGLARLAGKRVAIDPERSSAAITGALGAAGARIARLRDPIILAKAVKNAAEIAGHRAASLRDGAALSRFLRWAEVTLPAGTETELSAAARLHDYRRATGCLIDLSFDTISATGANGALPHYRVTAETDTAIGPGQLYLVDSGAQYIDGTTDVTRVIPVGTPTDEMRDRFTRVLRGHIALATAIFPRGTCGGHLDGFARRPLWEAGLDFAHGTGHGIGAYLSVHEGPQRIAAPTTAAGGTTEPLLAGMMLSNEPGYYKAGEFGIRIENLILVEERAIDGADTAMLGFETLTLAPIDRRMIVTAMLTPTERKWVDAYHARVLAMLGPAMDGDERAWLAAKCAPLDD